MRFVITLIVCALFIFPSVTKADYIYSFNAINVSSPWHTDPGFKPSVLISSSDNKAVFTFKNDCNFDCTITSIYFDTDVLSGIAGTPAGSTGVVFSKGASPKDLPAGKTISPVFDSDFGTASDSPRTPNGINPGEYLTFACTYTSGKIFSDLLDSLTSARTRIGLHIQSLPDGTSVAAINTNYPQHQVPEPATAALLLSAFAFLKKRR